MKLIKSVFISFLAICIAVSNFGFLSVSANNKIIQVGSVKVNDSLNVRSGAGTSYSVIDSLYNGNTVYITDTYSASDNQQWYYIYYTKNGGTKTGYVRSDYVTITGIVENEDGFEHDLTTQGFPESYKPMLRALHADYPNWIFQADHISPDWDEVLSAEIKLGRNLVSYLRPDSWKSVASGAYDESTGTWKGFDGSSWVAASNEIVAYYLDPRNFLNSSGIFLFSSHAFDGSTQTVENTKRVVSGTFLDSTFPEAGFDTYSDAIYYAGGQAGVSPYVLASMIIVEQGTGGQGGCISGNISGYEGIYNYLNINAYTTSSMTAVQRGLWWAAGGDGGTATSYGRPWNSRLKSLVGSAKFYANDYISVGQDTLYYKKFDVINDPATGLYWHQYMSNVEGAETEAGKLKKAYTDIMDTQIVFKIPVYSGMPENLYSKPTASGTVFPRLLVQKIADLPTGENITLADEGTISALRAKYESFTDFEKSIVTNLPTLEQAEAKIAALKNPDNSGGESSSSSLPSSSEPSEPSSPEDSQALADTVTEKINSIGEVTLDSENLIADARSAYNALNEEAKKLVNNLDILMSAEEALKALKTAAEAEAIVDEIKTLPLQPALEDGAVIQALMKRYSNLNAYGKAIVGDYFTTLIRAYEQWIAAGGVRLGDVDDDALVTVSDVVRLRSLIMAGDYTDNELTHGDMDDDKLLSVSDVVALRRYIMEKVY